MMKVAFRILAKIGGMMLVGVMLGCGGASAKLGNEMSTLNMTSSIVASRNEVSGKTAETVTHTRSNPNTVWVEGDDSLPVDYADFEFFLHDISFLSLDSKSDSTFQTPPSTAYYFLRDRSRTVYDICGSRYATAMKDIPNLIFTFLKDDKNLSDVDIYMGLGAFPNQGDQTPAVLESQSLVEINALSHKDWQAALDRTWNSTFTDNYDAAVFLSSITEAAKALRAKKADRNILVVFGDSMLDFPGGDKEWPDIIPQSGYESALTKILEDDPDDKKDGPHDDITLHYVQYDCLPAARLSSTIKDLFWMNGIVNWQKLQSDEDRLDIEQIDDEPLVVNDYIRVYGWKWYANAHHQERLLANLDPMSRPPSWHVPALLNGLIGNFLPSTSDRDTGLWKRQRFTKEVTLSADATSVVEMELPVPGYANLVTVHMLGFDTDWCVSNEGSNSRYRDDCGIRASGKGNLVYTTFEIEVNPPTKSCEGTIINLRPSEFSGGPLIYPALVWWEISPMQIPGVRVELFDMQNSSDSELVVPSRTYLELTLEWEGAENLSEDVKDYLNNCYSIDIVPRGSTTQLADGDYTLPRDITIPFDPGADSSLGFELAFDVIFQRKVNVSTFTDSPYITQDTVWSAANDIPTIRFEYAPKLEGTLDFENTGDAIIFKIPVLYTGKEYYPAGGGPAAPELFVLKRDNQTTAEGGCTATIKKDAPQFHQDDNVWLAKSLREGTGERHLLYGTPQESIIEPNDSSNLFEIHLLKSEVEKCEYEYLLINWDNSQFAPIACDLAEGECIQSFDFPEPQDDTVAMTASGQ